MKNIPLQSRGFPGAFGSVTVRCGIGDRTEEGRARRAVDGVADGSDPRAGTDRPFGGAVY